MKHSAILRLCVYNINQICSFTLQIIIKQKNIRTMPMLPFNIGRLYACQSCGQHASGGHIGPPLHGILRIFSKFDKVKKFTKRFLEDT